ncbi:MAG: hypothetical protein QM622_10305 [Microbacterium sp.]
MALGALREDALSATTGGFVLRLALPWIRSLPLASLTEVTVRIDGEPAAVAVRLGARTVAVADLGAEPGWWFVQDRVALVGDRVLRAGIRDVDVAFRLAIPYMPGRDGPLVLPFRAVAALVVDAAASATVSREVGSEAA